jgi:hypothetical protein
VDSKEIANFTRSALTRISRVALCNKEIQSTQVESVSINEMLTSIVVSFNITRFISFPFLAFVVFI